MKEATCGINRYIFGVCFNTSIPHEIEMVAENLLAAIPGVEEVNVTHDWAEVTILQEYLDELDDVDKFWHSLKKNALEIAAVTQTACLLYTKVGGK